MKTVRLGLSICAALALPSLAVAQKAPSAEAPPVFGEEIDVRVVNVEAVVTDRAGNRVTDLKPGDLRLRVDGKEVPISFFTEVRDGRSVAAPAGDGVGTAGPAGAAPGEAVGTSYLVFVDEYFSTVILRNQVLQALKKDLSRLGPNDTMAIVAFDGARLARISGWTGSAETLAKAFDLAMARPARGLDRVTDLRSFLDTEKFIESVVGRGPDGPKDPVHQSVSNSGLSEQQHAYGDLLVRQIAGVTSAAVSAMRGAGVPGGRKVMLLLSGGWPYSVQSFVLGSEALPLSHELPDGEQIFRPLTSTANLLGFTLYPVDVPGIAGDDAVREQETEGSLSFIAQETGGRALLNSARIETLTAAAADVRSFYWLGFTPAWERNDHRHKVEVTVLRPDLKVRSRNSFLDLSRKAEVSMRLESALLFGSLPDAVPMPMKIGAPVAGKGETEIPVTLGLPAAAMTLVPTAGKLHAHLELRVAAMDEKGNRSDVPVLPLDLSSDKPPKTGGFIRYDTRVKIRGKAKHIVVAVYDPLSGKIATAEADVAP